MWVCRVSSRRLWWPSALPTVPFRFQNIGSRKALWSVCPACFQFSIQWMTCWILLDSLEDSSPGDHSCACTRSLATWNRGVSHKHRAIPCFRPISTHLKNLPPCTLSLQRLPLVGASWLPPMPSLSAEDPAHSRAKDSAGLDKTLHHCYSPLDVSAFRSQFPATSQLRPVQQRNQSMFWSSPWTKTRATELRNFNLSASSHFTLASVVVQSGPPS